MGTVKTSTIRVFPHYHVSLELLVPTTSALQESPSPHHCLPDPFTTSLQPPPAPPGSPREPGPGPGWPQLVARAGGNPTAGASPSGGVLGAGRAVVSLGRRGQLRAAGCPQRAEVQSLSAAVGDGSEGKEEMAIPVRVLD